MQNKTRKYLGDGLLFLTALIWGMGFIAVKIGLNENMPPFLLLTFRFFIAAISMLVLIIIEYLIKRFKAIKAEEEILDIKTLDKNSIKYGMMLGIFMFLGFAFQTLGLKHTTTANNAFLTGVNVILVPWFSLMFLKHKLEKKQLLASLLTLVGIGALTLNKELSLNLGDMLTLVCAVMFALHITFTEKFTKDSHALWLVFFQLLTGGIFSLGMTIVMQEDFIVSRSAIMAILFLGVFSTMLAFLFQTLGQRYGHASRSALILACESLFGAIFAILIFNDPLTINFLIGSLTISAGIWLSSN